jgi:hypothetical protein
MPGYIKTNKCLSTSKDVRRLLFCCSIVAGITLIAFLPSLYNGFTNWDDDLYVVNNPDIKGVTPYNLAKIFSSSYIGNYQPLTMLTYMAEYSLFKLNPLSYHATNLLLHIVNGCLVVMLIYGLSCRHFFISFRCYFIYGIYTKINGNITGSARSRFCFRCCQSLWRSASLLFCS